VPALDHREVIRSRDDGATAVEYGLLIMMITLVVAGILSALFGSIGDAFTYVIGFLS
jgi:Flp pilus assembly pilin Flp